MLYGVYCHLLSEQLKVRKDQVMADTGRVNSHLEFSVYGGNNESNLCNGTFSEKQIDNLLIGLGTTGMASVLICSIAVIMVMLFRLYKKFVYRLALYQVLAALFVSLTQSLELLALHYDSKLQYYKSVCEAVGFLTQYSTWVKLMFTAGLTFHLFCLTIFFKNFYKLEIAYVLISVFSPLLHVWIPFIKHTYGMSGAWCGIRGWKDDCAKYTLGLIEQFTLWYGPFFLVALIDALVIIVIFVVLAVRAFRERRHHFNHNHEPLLPQIRDPKKEAFKQFLPLLIYPLLFPVLILSAMVDRVYDVFAKSPSYPLAMIHAVFGLSGALFTGLALILHLCLLKEWSKKKRVAVLAAPRHELSNTFPLLRSVNNYSDFAIVNVDPTTAPTTRPSIPAESEVDACKLGQESLAVPIV